MPRYECTVVTFAGVGVVEVEATSPEQAKRKAWDEARKVATHPSVTGVRKIGDTHAR